MDLQKAFDTILRPSSFSESKNLQVLVDIQWGIYALYESALETKCAPSLWSEVMDSIIGRKQTAKYHPLFSVFT